MQRRQVLAAVGTSVASLTGCIGRAAPGSDADSADFPALAVESTDDPPTDAAVAVRVTRQFAADHPADIEVSYTNTADAPRTVDFQATPPFSTYVSAGSDGPRLVVLPPDRSHLGTDADRLVPRQPADGCWRVTSTFARYGVAHPRTLDPGETVLGRYVVLGHPDNETCLPRTTYRFEQRHDDRAERAWGFTVSLADEAES